MSNSSPSYNSPLLNVWACYEGESRIMIVDILNIDILGIYTVFLSKSLQGQSCILHGRIRYCDGATIILNLYPNLTSVSYEIHCK